MPILGDGMHLKRIEVENFKSFGGEMVIPFDEGFTAITNRSKWKWKVKLW